jgi:hypothetical protein
MFLDWLKENQALAGWLVGLSVFMLIGSAVLVPFLVARMRSDYFMPERQEELTLASRHPVIRWTGLILKNLLGAILFLAGLAMFFTPGQGILTLFMGLMLLDFPGKRRLELRLIRTRAIHRAIDWIRQRAGREPLQLPERD